MIIPNSTKKINIKKCSLLISSFDGYSDLWSLNKMAFDKYWPDCPLEKYLLTNKKDSNLEGFRSLKTGEDIDWSTNLIAGLLKLPSEYIFLTNDDQIIIDHINSDLFIRYLSMCIENNWNYLRFHNSPREYFLIDKMVSKIGKRSDYRTSVKTALFKKSVLVDLLQSGESAWDFETAGSLRSEKYDDFYTMNENLFTHVNLIVKGMLEPIANWKMNKAGLYLKGSKYKKLDTLAVLKDYIKRIIWKHGPIQRFFRKFTKV